MTRDQPQVAPITGVCARCSKDGQLQCPKCREMGMPRQMSVFCSQECFKAAWAEHKGMHKASTASYMYAISNGRERSATMPAFAWTGPLRPHRVAPPREVPAHIRKPEWARTSVPEAEMRSIQQQTTVVRTPAQIEGFRAACQLGRAILDAAHRAIKPGITTDDIDRVVHDFTIKHGAYPSPLNYHGFPKSVCTSVNEVICHGIPDVRELRDGDIVNVDVSCYLNGYHGDLNETFIVGTADERTKQLVKVAYECLMRALKLCKPKTRYRDVGEVISAHASKHGCSVVKTFCGHGICDLFHCKPDVLHYARNKSKGTMEVGHTFTIEPMINGGVFRDVFWPDGWTVATADGARSAQFEHGIVITETGHEVLTARTEHSPPLWWETEGVALDV